MDITLGVRAIVTFGYFHCPNLCGIVREPGLTPLPFGRGLGLVTLLSVVMVGVVHMTFMRVYCSPGFACGTAVGAPSLTCG